MIRDPFYPMGIPGMSPFFSADYMNAFVRSDVDMTMRQFDFRPQMSYLPDSRLLRNKEESAPISDSSVKPSYDMDHAVLEQILRDIGSKQPEQGGALGIDKSTGRITRFFFDEQGKRSSCVYSPDTETVSDVINRWDEEGIAFCGMIHSHPGTFGCPSEGDRQYADAIIKAMPDTLHGQMFMPIVTVNLKKRQAWLHPYVAKRNDNGNTELLRAAVTVNGMRIDDPISIPNSAFHPTGAVNASQTVSDKASEGHPAEEDTMPQVASSASSAPDKAAESRPSVTGSEPPAAPAASLAPDKALEAVPPVSVLFQRNASILPVEELAQRTVVIVGCGGARGFSESLARCAVGRFILIDGDTVSETNVATQGTYVDEIGQYKTEVIAKTLRRVNPHIQIIEIHRFLDDAFSDDELASTIGEELLSQHPEHVLLCGCTDNFHAQDRTVKLALKWGVPYLASQTYAEGRGGEVIFNYPGVTTTCPRCMLSSRYEAYAQNTQTTVTSEGAPIYSTDRLNALKSHIAMMLLLYGTSSRLGRELDKVRDRNLVLASFADDIEEKLGISAFSRTFSALGDDAKAALPMEETVWLEQKPDRPENGYPHCPYCAGAGDLRLIRGLIADTRKPFDLTAFINSVLPKAE